MIWRREDAEAASEGGAPPETEGRRMAEQQGGEQEREPRQADLPLDVVYVEKCDV